MKSDAIILKTSFLKGADLLIEAFTKDFGLIKLAYRGGASQKRKQGASTLALAEAEIVFEEGKSGLGRCKEITPHQFNLKIRESMPLIQTAGQMIRLIRLTQMENKPAPLLFQLFLSYLKKLPDSKNLTALLLSFYLKLLKHEGLYNGSDLLATSKNFAEIESQTITREKEFEIHQLFAKEYA